MAESEEGQLPSFIRIAIDEIEQLSKFGRMVELGFHLGSTISPLFSILRKRFEGDTKAEEAIDALRPLAEELQPYAAAQKSSRMPRLKSLLVIWYVTILETVVRDVVVESLARPVLPVSDELLRMKGPVFEILSAPPSERAEYLFTILDRETQASLKRNVDRFEVLLKAVGLGGRVDDLARKVLVELINVRHVVVHRRGHVDKRLLESCPWMTVEIGNVLQITPEMSERYRLAAVYYVIELMVRWFRRHQADSDLSQFEAAREDALRRLRESDGAG